MASLIDKDKLKEKAIEVINKNNIVYSEITAKQHRFMANEKNIEKYKFKKGESGNPNGRAVGSRNRSTKVKDWLGVKKRAKNPISGKEEELEIQDMMVLALINKALKGDVNAYKELMDSGYGKLSSSTDITTKGESINIPISKWAKDDTSDTDTEI